MHNKAAVNNVLKLIEQLNVDILFVQELHIVNFKIICIPNKYRGLVLRSLTS